MAEPSTAVPSAAAGAIGPFAGVRVLELTRGIAGRTAGMLLADLGADVVRASDDRPDTERDPGGLCWDRGKVLAPLHGTSTNELRRLAAAADVLVDNLRADSMTRLGLGDGVLAAGLPRLVRCSVSAYGRTGPFADLPGFDPVMQARSGMMLAQGGADDPVASVAPVHDVATAALAALGILAALFARARTGLGQHVTASLAATSVFLQSGELTTFTGRPAAQAGGVDFPGPSAVRRYYQASDGWLAVAATTAAHVAELLSAVGHPEWGALDDATLADRLTGVLTGRPVDAWIIELAARQVPACRVLPRAGELADPFLVENEFSHVVVDPVVGKLRIVRSFSDWPGTRPASDRPPRGTTVGEETVSVLAAAGISLTS